MTAQLHTQATMQTHPARCGPGDQDWATTDSLAVSLQKRWCQNAHKFCNIHLHCTHELYKSITWDDKGISAGCTATAYVYTYRDTCWDSFNFWTARQTLHEQSANNDKPCTEAAGRILCKDTYTKSQYADLEAQLAIQGKDLVMIQSLFCLSCECHTCVAHVIQAGMRSTHSPYAVSRRVLILVLKPQTWPQP